MKQSTMITVAVIVVVLVLVLTGFLMSMNYSNQEIQLRNQILAKQQDNKNQYDRMWKTISQVAQVAKEDRDSLMKIFIDYADARTSNSDKLIMNWIKETVPNIDSSTYKNLQNVIISSRDNFAMRQTELIDYNRVHDSLIDTWPGSWFLKGRQKIKITIITSSKTENAFETGTDNDVNVFNEDSK